MKEENGAGAHGMKGFIARVMAAAKQALGVGNGSSPAAATAPATVADSTAGNPPQQTDPQAKAVARPKAEGPVPKPAESVTPPVVTVKASPDLHAVEVSHTDATPVVPALAATVPPSRAFTVWTVGRAFEPAGGTNQRVTLAAVIESQTSGTSPLPSKSPTVPPVPMVPASNASGGGHGHGTTPLPLLDLEPLVVPGESANR